MQDEVPEPRPDPATTGPGWSARLRRGLTEFLVIVVGVLAALWIDAGWSWLQDRDEERLILADLAADFTANLETIDQTLASHDAQLRAVERGLSADLTVLPMEEILPMTRDVFILETFLPRTGALEAAISSGRLNLIRNRALRSRLTGWERLVAEAIEEVDFAWPGNVELLNHLNAGDFVFFPITADRAYQTLTDTAAARRWIGEVFADSRATAFLKTKSMFVAEARPDFLALREETALIVEMIRAN